MKSLKAFFEIAEDINCPLYDQGEIMQLSDKTFSCPTGKEVCLILVRDMTQLLFTLLGDAGRVQRGISSKVYSCSGCTGLMKFKQVTEPLGQENCQKRDGDSRVETAMQEIHGVTVESPFLQSIPPEKLHQVLKSFTEVVVPTNTELIRQGEQNTNLYLVIFGKFAVEMRGEQIATLGPGDIFGETSYLSSGSAVATVRSVKESKTLAFRMESFGEMLESEPSVQGYVARLLATRLQQTNQARARDFESCMTGKLDEVPPTELLQIFHMHQKTGLLLLILAGGEAKISFRKGSIVSASYRQEEGREAIYSVLAEKKGYYRFTTGLSAKEMDAAELGDFMALLMEGVRRLDEAV